MVKIVKGSRAPLKTKKVQFYTNVESFVYMSQIILDPCFIDPHINDLPYVITTMNVSVYEDCLCPRFVGHYTCRECLSKCSFILTTAVTGDILDILSSFLGSLKSFYINNLV